MNMKLTIARKKEEIDLESIDIFIPKKVAGEDDDAGFGNEGKVSFFDDSKGFGFIIDNKNSTLRQFINENGSYKISGNDPSILFDISNLNLT